ncbi:MAG: hypothetical protein BWX45_00187 [Deltaproteobacteria bacterium ADurb.Bin002]|nr:MAG: hypothetical protein BWX45_00187 [Deltaproteobacteria bacterium ADurb.Bin002]
MKNFPFAFNLFLFHRNHRLLDIRNAFGRRQGNKQAGIGKAEDCIDIFWRKFHIERNGYPSRLLNGKVRDHKFRRIGKQNPNFIVTFYTLSGKNMGQAVCPLIQRQKIQLLTLGNDSDLTGMSFYSFIQQSARIQHHL